MLIQNVSNLASVYATAKPAAFQRPTAATANSADTVTISDAAKSLARSSPRARGGPDIQYQESILKDAQNDPAFAEQMAHDFAYDDSLQTGGPLMDISKYPLVSYTYTGELVTDTNLSVFKTEAATARSGRVSLYQVEKSRGTPDAEILEKLFRYTDTQSDSYLNKVGWERAASTTSMAT